MLTLTCTVHDPKAGLLWLVKKQAVNLQSLFDQVVVVATKSTDKKLVAALRDFGVVIRQRTGDQVGVTYYEAIKDGWATGADRIFYCDLDRILHWAEFRTAELTTLAKALRRADKTDYMALERSERAYDTHHDALIETEAIANAVISRSLAEDKIHDYLSGAFVLSRRAAEWILRDGQTFDLGFWSLWPLLVRYERGRLGYRVCEGLEWETPDRYRDEVKKAGGIKKWREGWSSAQEWAYRTDMAQQFVRPLVS